MEYHVSISGDDKNTGDASAPFRTISKAAALAVSGDTVVVHGGVYRECVSPVSGGKSDSERITYIAAEGERPVIKGSEVVKDWESIGGGIYKATVDNGIFEGINPYAETIDGDWLMRPTEPFLHTGGVYIDGKMLSEVSGRKDVTAMTWHGEVGESETVIYANFGDIDPEAALIEINVRRSCFYPEKTGVNYITVSGFEMAHAATPWAPPTADQPGMLGAHWSKGWIIENNILHDARCSAISVGKEASTGHNPYTRTHRKSGYQFQLETVFKALHAGWSKENIGSHIIRNNTIYDCGQNGIVGNLGCAFSQIYGNHIYNIGNRHEFFGYEIAGVKLHAAIDLYLHDNKIHDCALGTWLDWQAQGARISSNIYYDNERDFWIEVTHGPYLMDNNIFGSECNLTNNAQGGAYAHNLFCGRIQRYDVRNRSTPYHFAHTTEVAGCAQVYGGDDRYYANVFCGIDEGSDDFRKNWHGGTAFYNGCSASLEEYIEKVLSHGRGDIETFECEKQPVYISENCYYNGAEPYENESYLAKTEENPSPCIYRENGAVYLEITLSDVPKATKTVTTELLGTPRISEQKYENPDGTPLKVNRDLLGGRRSENPTAGPIEGLKIGKNKIKLKQF